MARGKQPRPKKPSTPPSLKPWDQFPWLPQGEEKQETIYLAVGHALHSWELLECQLARAFGALVQSKEEGALRAYGCVASFSARSDMLTMVFDCYPESHDPTVTGFPKLLEEAKKFSARRNEIAHGVVQSFRFRDTSSREGYFREPTDRGFYLVPPWYGSRKQTSLRARQKRFFEEMSGLDQVTQNWPPFEKYAYTAAQIDIYRTRFEELTERLWPIADRLFAITTDLLEKTINQHIRIR